MNLVFRPFVTVSRPPGLWTVPLLLHSSTRPWARLVFERRQLVCPIGIVKKIYKYTSKINSKNCAKKTTKQSTMGNLRTLSGRKPINICNIKCMHLVTTVTTVRQCKKVNWMTICKLKNIYYISLKIWASVRQCKKSLELVWPQKVVKFSIVQSSKNETERKRIIIEWMCTERQTAESFECVCVCALYNRWNCADPWLAQHPVTISIISIRLPMMIGMIGDVIDLGFIYSKQAIVITDHKKKRPWATCQIIMDVRSAETRSPPRVDLKVCR